TTQLRLPRLEPRLAGAQLLDIAAQLPLSGLEPCLPGAQLLDIAAQLRLSGLETGLARPEILDIRVQTAEFAEDRIVIAVDPSSKGSQRFRLPIPFVDDLHDLGLQDSKAVLDRHLE
ncbi:hypothetical protein ABZV91_07195, partial [Nocardia sp. NPDC004568]|uniref:hypothetical protein n=1 Tax=Nocardia sp. NPDC004568 TaxID=3154551 RepID=UPI0033ABC32E